jgi:pyruvate-formate lyase-activating enzyme
MELDENIPFHILAFFPQYKLKDIRTPKLTEIINTFKAVKEVGLKQVKVGNIAIFTKNDDERNLLIKEIGLDAI